MNDYDLIEALKQIDIDKMINDAITACSPPITPCDVTNNAMKAIERRLYEFPDICLRAKEVESGSLKALILNIEISKIKKALSFIADDPYYRTIPDCYFYGLRSSEVGISLHCDGSTVHRNKRRILERLALYLYGVEAWIM